MERVSISGESVGPITKEGTHAGKGTQEEQAELDGECRMVA